jgi:hypothetical protein
MATAGNPRNGAHATTPTFMESHDGLCQRGVTIRADWGVTVWKYVKATATLTTADLNADAVAGPALDIVNTYNSGAGGINSLDDHWALACGVDYEGRIHLAGNTHVTNQNYCFSDADSLTTWHNSTYANMPWFTTGANRHTYNHFIRMSDGTLLWFFDQGDTLTSSRGRDYLGYYLPPGTSTASILAGTGWLKIVGPTSNGVFLSTNADSPQGVTADRVYLIGATIEARTAGDRLHIIGIWRTEDEEGDSQQQPFYAYTDSIGTSTWHNVSGGLATMPITWATRSQVAITSAPGFSSATSWCCMIDGSGYPHVILKNGNSLGDGVLTGYSTWVRCYWDGSAWQVVSLAANAIGSSNGPSAYYINRGIYITCSAVDRAKVRANAGLNSTDPYFYAGGPVDSVFIDANHGETYTPIADPVGVLRGRLELHIPDGDTPKVFGFGNHHPCNAA